MTKILSKIMKKNFFLNKKPITNLSFPLDSKSNVPNTLMSVLYTTQIPTFQSTIHAEISRGSFVLENV